MRWSPSTTEKGAVSPHVPPLAHPPHRLPPGGSLPGSGRRGAPLLDLRLEVDHEHRRPPGDGADSQPASSTSPLTINEIYRRTNQGIVKITVSSVATTTFGGTQQQEAQGSGWVYDANGDIVTDQHVVAGARSIKVTFWNGKTYTAKLVGADGSTDLAVVKVSAPSSLLHPLSLGDSSKLPSATAWSRSAARSGSPRR